MNWQADPLAILLDRGIEKAEQAVIDNRKYLDVFGVKDKSLTAGELVNHILDRLLNDGNEALELKKREIYTILTKGSLSTRIVKAIGKSYSQASLMEVYQVLNRSLSQNIMFLP
jgi:carboxylate-amine ligase